VTSVAPGDAIGVDTGLDPTDGSPRLPLGADGDAAPAPEPARGRLRRLWFVPAGVALLGAAALVPSVGGGGPGAGEARVLVDGVAVVTDADGVSRTVRDDRVDVGPGDEVEITDGRAVFEMAGDVRLEGLGRGDGRAGTTVEMAVSPRLVEGRLLAVAPTPIEIEAGDATVTIDPSGATDGAARLDRRIGLGVGTYQGRVAVESAGHRADVPLYRRVEVAAPGAMGPDDLPLRYDPGDGWDRRFLADALVIDAQVAPLLASLGPDERDSFLDPATLRRAMPGLPTGAALTERLAAADDGGSALVLAAIASAVDDRSFTTAWDEASAFQGDGAPWGLAALDQGARSSDVLPTLRSALDTLDLQAPTTSEDEGTDGTEAADDGDGPTADPADPDATTPDGGAATDTDGTTPTTDPGGGGTTDPGEVPGGVPGVPVPPTTIPGVTLPPPPTIPPIPPLPPTPNVPEVVEGVGGVVGGVVDGVGGVVDGVLPGAGGPVDEVVDGLGGAVGGLSIGVGAVGDVVGEGVVGEVVTGLGDTLGGLGSGLGGTGGG